MGMSAAWKGFRELWKDNIETFIDLTNLSKPEVGSLSSNISSNNRL